jgi:hypothetical protein
MTTKPTKRMRSSLSKPVFEPDGDGHRLTKLRALAQLLPSIFILLHDEAFGPMPSTEIWVWLFQMIDAQ